MCESLRSLGHCNRVVDREFILVKVSLEKNKIFLKIVLPCKVADYKYIPILFFFFKIIQFNCMIERCMKDEQEENEKEI